MRNYIAIITHCLTLKSSVRRTWTAKRIHTKCLPFSEAFDNYTAVFRWRNSDIGVGDGGGVLVPRKFGKNIFSGNYYVKFWHFVNFSGIFSRKKCLAP